MITVAVLLTFLSVSLMIAAFGAGFLFAPRRAAVNRLRDLRPTTYEESLTMAAVPVAVAGPPGSLWERFFGKRALAPADLTSLTLKPEDARSRTLLHAGFRTKRAERLYRIARLCCAIVMGFAGALATSGAAMEPSAKLLAIAVPGLAGYIGPRFWLRMRARRRQHRLRLSLPDALDLLVVCVEAGMGLNQAIVRVSEELRGTHPEIAEEFRLVNLEIRAGRSRSEALRSMGERTGVDDLISLAAMIIQTDKFGTSIAKSLRVHSDSLRVERRQRAEEAAAKTTIKLIFPLLFCIFPSLFVIIIGPAAMHLARIFGANGVGQ